MLEGLEPRQLENTTYAHGRVCNTDKDYSGAFSSHVRNQTPGYIFKSEHAIEIRFSFFLGGARIKHICVYY